MGEGAVITTRNEKLFEKIKLMRNQGRPHSGVFIHPELGMNFRITDIQAAIGYAQVKKFPDILAYRQLLWQQYQTDLLGVGDIGFMSMTPHSTLTPFRFPITTKYSKALQQFLKSHHIASRGFFYPMHLQPKLKSNPVESLPISELLSDTGLCLPIHHHISLQDVQYITTVIKQFYQQL